MAKRNRAGAVGFMVKDGRGILFSKSGIHVTRAAARRAIADRFKGKWKNAYRAGCRVVMVDVREIGP